MPSPTYREIPLTFEKGVVTAYEASLLPEGTAALLENWVPEETGGVRVREGWKKSPLTGGPTTSKGLGLGIFTATRRIFRQRKTNSDDTAGAGIFPISVTWDTPTKVGSTLIAKFVDATNGLTSLPESPPGGWQVVHGAIVPNAQHAFVLVKENAGSEATSSFNIRLGASAGSWLVEMVELQSVQTSTPKNLLPASWSNVDHPTSVNQTAFDGYSGWESISGAPGNPIWTPTEKKSGNTSILFGMNTVSAWEYGTRVGTSGIPITGGSTYTGSVYIQASTGGEILTFSIRWYDNSGAFISRTDGTSLAVTTSFTRYTATGAAPSNAVYASIAVRGPGAGASRNYYNDEAQFELGASATAWERGHITSVDKDAIGVDTANPVATTGGTATVSSSWAEASILAPFDSGSPGIPSADSWTNGFTEGLEATVNASVGGVFDCFIASAFKIITGLASIDTATTITNMPANLWASVLNIKLSTADAISLDKFYITAHDDTTALKLYYINQSDIDSGSYSLIESVAVTPDGSPVAFASGLGSLLYTNTAFAAVRRWPGLGEVPSALAPVAGTCIAFFKSRFFVGGTTDQPTRLVYSDIGSYTSYPAANYIEVGQDDGYTVLDIATQESYLIIGKGNSIYTLSGSGPDTFFLYKMPAGDSAPGRSICVTPSGAIVAGATAVWIISGSTVEAISKNLGATYKPTGYVHTAYNDDLVYIHDVDAKKTFVYNLTTQAWHIEKFTSVNNQIVAYISAGAGRLLSSPVSSTDTGLVMYRDLPSLTRTRDFVPLSSQTILTTPTMWPVGPRSTMTPRWLFLQIRQRGNEAGQLTLTGSYDEGSGPSETFEIRNAGASRHRIDLGGKRSCSSVSFTLTGPDASNQYDIEDAVLGFEEMVGVR